MGGGDAPVAEAATAVIFYPLDVLISTAVAVRALFHPGIDITWGPVGAVAGITLPWVTLIPHLYPPLCMLWPTPEVNLSPAEFQSLVARIRQGDGLSAYRELVDVGLWACQDAVMMSVVLVTPRMYLRAFQVESAKACRRARLVKTSGAAVKPRI